MKRTLPAPIAALLLLVLPLPATSREAASVESNLRASVERLAGDAWQGRRAGTPGADRAADWIAGQFKAFGLAPGGEGGTYFQTFSFIDGVVLGRGNKIVVAGAATGKAGEDFRPLAFSAAGTVSGELAFAGYGIVATDLGHDDYTGLEVKDRIVLVLRYGPEGSDPQSKWAPFTALRQKASTARDRGAKALLIVTGPRTQHVQDELVPLRADASLSDAGLPVFSVKRTVAEALLAGRSLDEVQGKLESGPAGFVASGSRVEVTADLTPRRSTSRNVIGVVKAASAAAETVAVGAHYDHLGLGMSGSLDPAPDGKIHHGADDNASGVAGLLELGRRAAKRRDGLRRSLVFIAFGAEELGTLGSSHFVKGATVPFEKVAAMVNMDMIGRLRGDALDVHGTGTSPLWTTLIEEANRSVGLKLKLQEGGYGPSDHSPFYAAGKPVFFVFTGAHAQYHRPSDTADTLNYAGLAKVLSFVEPVIDGLARSEASIPFTRVATEKEQQASPARGFRVWVGGIPDYSEEGAGVKFSGMSPGSPAEKAGLRGGDVLVRFGPKEIRNIYDYTYALADRKPGEVVTLVVKREGTEVTLELTLGTRPGGAH